MIPSAMTATGTPTPAPIAAPFDDPPPDDEAGVLVAGALVVVVADDVLVLDEDEDDEVVVLSCDRGICARIVAAGLMRKMDVGLSQQWKLPMP